MYSSLLLPVVLTLNEIIGLLQLSIIVKAALWGGFLTVLGSDLLSVKKFRLGDPSLAGFLLASQFFYFLNLMLIRLSPSYSDLEGGSFFHIFGLALIPMLILAVSSVDAERRKVLVDLPWALGGACLVVILMFPLAFTPLATLNTENIYGDISTSVSVLREFRIALPGFSGVISGGVYAGVTCLACISFALTDKRILYRALAAIAAIFGLVLVVLTETRSPLLTMVPLASLVLPTTWKIIGKYPKTTASILVVIPVLMPFVYVHLVDGVIAISPEFIEHRFSRTERDSFWLLTGRVGLWEDFTSMHHSWVNLIFGYGPLGEYVSGAADIAAANSQYVFRSIQGLHSHNAFLNIWYSNGLVGLIVLISAVWLMIHRAIKTCTMTPSSSSYATFTLLAGIIIECSIESLFSITYQHFMPLLVLIGADVLRFGRGKSNVIPAVRKDPVLS